jgi:hypothetical protein
LGSRGFSIYAVVRYDRFKWDAPVFVFGNAFDDQFIMVDCRVGSGESAKLRLIVRNRLSQYTTVEVEDLFRLGEDAPVLFTVSASGDLSMWHEGVQVGTKDGNGHPATGPFAKMYIAGGIGDDQMPTGHDRRRRRDAAFEGSIRDIRIWDREVGWPEAVAGVPEDQAPRPDDITEEEAELDIPCTPSQLNTWDFACDEALPPELANEFGYVGGIDADAKTTFETREEMGEVVVCGIDVSVMGYVFHGQFGDGLTGEYFRLRSNGCNPPFVFGQVPFTVQVDPTVNFTGGFASAYNEFVIRWSGKLLVLTPGTYKFELESKDGSWLAIAGAMLIDNGGCHSTQTRTGSLDLDKGSYDIEVLNFNRGPVGAGSPGWCKLTYQGPDTNAKVVPLPQERLGSNPMRLAKIERETDSNDDEQTEDAVIPGYFVYDESSQLAVMPVGACSMSCRQGLLKNGAVPARFFCSAPTQVSFIAHVDDQAELAMAWLDEEPLRMWTLKEQSPSLLARSSREGEHVGDFHIVASETSPSFAVLPGEHTLYVQGRVADDQGFAMRSIRFDQGQEHCTWFLEGQDKTYNDCR